MKAKHKTLWALSLLGALTGTTLLSINAASAASEDGWRCRKPLVGANSYGIQGCEYERYPLGLPDLNDTGERGGPSPGPSPAPAPYGP